MILVLAGCLIHFCHRIHRISVWNGHCAKTKKKHNGCWFWKRCAQSDAQNGRWMSMGRNSVGEKITNITNIHPALAAHFARHRSGSCFSTNLFCYEAMRLNAALAAKTAGGRGRWFQIHQERESSMVGWRYKCSQCSSFSCWWMIGDSTTLHILGIIMIQQGNPQPSIDGSRSKWSTYRANKVQQIGDLPWPAIRSITQNYVKGVIVIWCYMCIYIYI